jgi:large subunit ribosomal protein L23
MSLAFKQTLQKRAEKNIEKKAIKKFSIYDILLAPMVTEKTYKSQESLNKYYFKIHKNANKNDVKEAIQSLYKVTPQKVNIVSVGFKYRANRGLVRKSYKKAIVTLSKNDKIEVGA